MKWLGNIFSPVLIPLLVLIIVVCKIFYFLWPWLRLDRFYMPTHHKKDRKKRSIYIPRFIHLPKMKFRHASKELEFSCGWNVTKIALDYLGIEVSESQLYEMTGDKNMGTSHWEIQQVINYILKQQLCPWQAKICTRVRLQDLEEYLSRSYPIILLFLTPFKQEGMGPNAHYHHFGLLKTIDWGTKKIQILSPSGAGVYHEEVLNDAGVVEFNISDFLHIFYARPKFLMKVEYLSTRNKGNILVVIQNITHWIYNLFIQVTLIGAYCLRIINPGTIVLIEPINKIWMLPDDISFGFFYQLK